MCELSDGASADWHRNGPTMIPSAPRVIPSGVVDTAALKATAEAATPGPWEHYDLNEGTMYRPGWMVANDAFHNPPADDDTPWLAVELYTGIEADAVHIAAFDPPTVLLLLAELDTLRATVARVEALRLEWFLERGNAADYDYGRWHRAGANRLAAALVSPTPDPTEACECVGYTIRTDYVTGTEHDVDRSSCPTHGDPTTP